LIKILNVMLVIFVLCRD